MTPFDFNNLGLPGANALETAIESFLTMRFMSPFFLFLVAITLTPWMVQRMRDGLDLRVINVRGRRANQARWLDEDNYQRRLWYIGRATAGWIASALGNPFAIWPQGWNKEHRELFKLALKEEQQAKKNGERVSAPTFNFLVKNQGDWNQARDESITRYRGWLRQEVGKGLRGQPSAAFAELQEINHELLSGEKVALGCWCRPDPCHGDAVVDAVAFLQLQEMDDDELQRRFGSKRYRTIIAAEGFGKNMALIDRAVEKSGLGIDYVFSSQLVGSDWARQKNLKYHTVFADAEGGKSATMRANEVMAEQGEALIAVWDGKSPGTKHMIDTARAKGLAVFVYRADQADVDEADL